MEKDTLILTSVTENSTREELKEWQDRIYSLEGELDTREAKALYECLKVFATAGMPPNDAMRMSIVMVNPTLVEFFLGV